MAVLAALALAGCGEVQIQKPQAAATDLVSNSAVAASFTASGRWRLVGATVDGRDLTSSFHPQVGNQGQASQANLSLTAGAHRLEIVADIGPNNSPFGLTRSTKDVRFNVAPPTVTLVLPHFTPRDSPELYDSRTRLNLKVTPNFDWRDLRAQRTTAERPGSSAETSSFAPGSGARGQPSTAAVFFGNGAHRLLVGVKDATGAEFTAEGIVRIASGAPPLCNVSAECLLPGTGNHVAEGSRMSAVCGGGVWRYTDARREECHATEGAPRSTTEHNRTVCDFGTRQYLSGVASCVDETSFLANPPAVAFPSPRQPDPPPACRVDHVCDTSTLTCGTNQYKQHSIGGGCFCEDCPAP